MLLTFLSLIISCSLSIPQTNLIEWNAGRRLTWDDFKAQPDAVSSNAALTSSSINVEFGYSNKSLQYNIKCRFDKNLSWVRIKNDHILRHEQGHFDIAEIHARKLNKALKAYVFNFRTVSKDVNKIYEAIMKEHHGTQKQYDQETDHSRKPATQDEWLEKIKKDLRELADYSEYRK